MEKAKQKIVESSTKASSGGSGDNNFAAKEAGGRNKGSHEPLAHQVRPIIPLLGHPLLAASLPRR